MMTTTSDRDKFDKWLATMPDYVGRHNHIGTLFEAFQAGASLNAVGVGDGWISVKDYFPPESLEVIVCNADNDIYTTSVTNDYLCQTFDDKLKVHFDLTWARDSDVTHWRRMLPRPNSFPKADVSGEGAVTDTELMDYIEANSKDMGTHIELRISDSVGTVRQAVKAAIKAKGEPS